MGHRKPCKIWSGLHASIYFYPSCVADTIVYVLVSQIKLRIDQSWNVRLLWEGRVKELLVSAGVGLGPGSFSLSPSVSSASPSGAAQSGGGTPGMSYWRGVGVSVLYSS